MDELVLPPDDSLGTRCRRYLETQKTVLWGESFDIHEGTGLDRAADWLAEVVSMLVDARCGCGWRGDPEDVRSGGHVLDGPSPELCGPVWLVVATDA